MAPELLRGDKTYTEAVDIYSMAMVLFEALTLEIPYDGFHVGQLVVLVSQKVGVLAQLALPSNADVVCCCEQEQRPQLWHAMDDQEQAAQDLMARCWVHHPGDRPRAAQLIEELRVIIDAC